MYKLGHNPTSPKNRISLSQSKDCLSPQSCKVKVNTVCSKNYTV